MVSAKELVSVIESCLLGQNSPTAAQRVELIHAIRNSLSSLKSLLLYPPPKQTDRAEVESKEVRLPSSGPILLDDQDVHIALKLSEDLHLNEIDCVRLLVSANQEWGLLGREPVEIFRLAAGLWYTERRDILTAIYTLLRAVVLDQGLEADIVIDIQRFLEDLLASGLRQRLITLNKELSRVSPMGSGELIAEPYILDSRGSLVERKAVISRERLIVGHCLVLTVLVERAGPNDIKELFCVLKDSAKEYSGSSDSLQHQITFSLLFSVIIAIISDALSTVSDKVPVLSHDPLFRREFQDIVVVSGNDPFVEGFSDCVRLAWVVHLMLVQDRTDAAKDILDDTISNDIYSCLDVIFSHNVFQFWLEKIIRTAAYENDDEDMMYMYNAYLHKQMTCFLSHPLARDKVKETKENAMALLSPYRATAAHYQAIDGTGHPQETHDMSRQPFISLLEFVAEIYQREPELLIGNDVIWTFVKFAAEDHTNFQTLVAFLKMLSTLACKPDTASKVFELLQEKSFRSIGWSTLFECLSIYDEKFKLSLQSPGIVLPEFQEGDARALVAYLNVLQKVVENGSPFESKSWFPDIEPLFKLLSYENVPPYLKGALRDAISVFVRKHPVMKDVIWRNLELYDLPVVVGLAAGNVGLTMETPVYDMRFELNEIEARREQYPSTISFLNLLNTLIADERDTSDRGRRFSGIFRFVYDHVFGPFPQRAYSDPSEKWELVIACLKHFQMMLIMYEIGEEDIDIVSGQSKPLVGGQAALNNTQLPVVELMKDFMSGKTAFRNIMGIILPGANFLISERTNQKHGRLLEKAVLLSLEIIILGLEKDIAVSDFWRPLYQPLDAILSQDHNQIVALLELVRYDFQPEIQLCSIRIFSILSSRIAGLSQLLLKSNAASSLVEDYASCLELRSEDCEVTEDSSKDPGVLILQLLIENISRPAPNITHLLLKFDIDSPVERTLLQPKFHYSCLKVILGILDKLSNPVVNALLHEFSFKLLYELCIDPLTSTPIMDLLCSKNYKFFAKHLNYIGVAPLPERNGSLGLRISSLHQRAWLLKLLAVELHAEDTPSSAHRETCRSILAELFGSKLSECGIEHVSSYVTKSDEQKTMSNSSDRNKVLEMLEIIQFESPDISLKSSEFVSSVKFAHLAEDILTNPGTSEKGVYYYSERGDRLINLGFFSAKLWQKCNYNNLQASSSGNETELNEIREAIQQLLRWGWKYNKNLEEKAAQLHMLTSWSQIVEISASQKISIVDNRSEILFHLLDAALNASGSPKCSTKMAQILTQVGLTCMAKLRDERFVFPGGLNSDTVTCFDIIIAKRLSNGACHSILFKLIMAIHRHDSSEALRRRQYALLLSYFQYCWHMVDPDVPNTILQFLSDDEQESGDLDLEKINKDQAELAHTNFSIVKKEAQPFLNLVIKDVNQGSESTKTMSLYVLDALIRFDHDMFFLGQLQSRGFLRACFINISNFSYQNCVFPYDSMQRISTLEAELALLLRISHKYGKSGAEVLFSMGSIEHISSCRALNLRKKPIDKRMGRSLSAEVDEQRMVVAPILRLLFSLTSQVDTSAFFEVKNKVVREILDFVKVHQFLFDQIIREDLSDANELTMELINLVVAILGKVWPYEESDEYGFIQGLFGMMCSLFSGDPNIFVSTESSQAEIQRKAEENMSRLCFNLSSYLSFLVTKKSLRLQIADHPTIYSSARGQPPTLTLIVFFLDTLAMALERASDEKCLLLNKLKDINELARQELDEIINIYLPHDSVSASENMQKRRYTAMVGICQIVGHRNRLIMLLLLLAQNMMNIFLAHFQDSQSLGVNTSSSPLDSKEDLRTLSGKLVPVLERFEILREDKTGHSLKVFGRLARSLKEMAMQKLAL